MLDGAEFETVDDSVLLELQLVKAVRQVRTAMKRFLMQYEPNSSSFSGIPLPLTHPIRHGYTVPRVTVLKNTADTYNKSTHYFSVLASSAWMTFLNHHHHTWSILFPSPLLSESQEQQPKHLKL